MAMVKVTSTLESNIPNNFNTKSDSVFQDASFSSYLNGAEDTFVLNLEPSGNLSQKEDDGEIDIFSAEKYFNEGVDEENQENATNSESQNKHKIAEAATNIALLKQKIRPKTPSIHSESSWNSRSALLQNISRNHQHQTPTKTNNKSYGKKFLARIGCNCYCKDKNSVKVDDQVGGNSFNSGKYHGKSKQNPIKTRSLAQSSESSTRGANHQDLHFKKIDELGFGKVPVFDPIAGNPGVKIQLQKEEDIKRKSLEVFGSSLTEKERTKLSLEKKVSMLAWDAIATKPEEIDIINIGASSGTYEDDYAESDASSDLFEIESFPSNNTANPSFVRQGSDGMSCYAPSEVSIDWSVVTASAADFSIMSDSEEMKIPSIRTKYGKETAGREKAKRRSGTFLGCNSHKAVGVVGDAYKGSEKTSMEMTQRQLKTECVVPMTRFHAESKMSRFDSGNRKHEFTTRSFSSSYTGRPADFLYI
ncbi:protein PHYTOCHROME KINASE SUBSTRATE 1-like [Nicotiana sylvestris]|uniref:Protein PHYTOCHROME KINASE SUBSTRATE 1-like n=1 Tax=Nicotiana sylvestris TaxID=4096 RepID=A0A1U7UZP3_NICSY|nr:PREDICTED: protein PHYTOCHROME KINASE SUBSTRATE 1-like [Nicotiana sylvestris]